LAQAKRRSEPFVPLEDRLPSAVGGRARMPNPRGPHPTSLSRTLRSGCCEDDGGRADTMYEQIPKIEGMPKDSVKLQSAETYWRSWLARRLEAERVAFEQRQERLCEDVSDMMGKVIDSLEMPRDSGMGAPTVMSHSITRPVVAGPRQSEELLGEVKSEKSGVTLCEFGSLRSSKHADNSHLIARLRWRLALSRIKSLLPARASPLEKQVERHASDEVADENMRAAGRLHEMMDSADSMGRFPSLMSAGKTKAATCCRGVKVYGFEAFFFFVLVFSLAVMCVEIQYEGSRLGIEMNSTYKDESYMDEWPHASETFDNINKACTVLFCLEILMRMYREHWHYPRSCWNWIDFASSAVAVFAWTGGAQLLVNPRLLRSLRLMKLGRGLRVFRLGQAMDSLNLILKSMRASVSVFIWSCLILFAIQCLAAMLVSQLLFEYLRNEPELLQPQEEIYEKFGTFTRALLTMFEISLANWAPIVRLLMNNVSEWYAFFFLFYRCCVGFSVLAVISAVFISETMKVAANNKDILLMQRERAKNAYTKHLKMLFRTLDDSKDGFLSWDEFSHALANNDAKMWLSALEVDPQQAETLFRMLDKGSGVISVDEFILGIMQLKGPAKSIDVVHLLSLVRRLDHLVRSRIPAPSKNDASTSRVTDSHRQKSPIPVS